MTDKPHPELPLRGLRVLDIGCGGGLLSEGLSRLGAQVVGVDATPENIAIANERRSSLRFPIPDGSLEYRHSTAEELAAQGELFDAVCALEVVEHVSNVPMFFESCAKLLRPEGTMVVSTLNRTWRSFAEGIIAAEYALLWVPQGTHEWDKFLRPDEVLNHAHANGIILKDVTGYRYNMLKRRFETTPNVDVNYMCYGVKRGETA
jgi:2-polyprenyl-6-hydroxyphenyl methylase/3-demethylubiquinone-9 3-methyltransferase